MHNPSFQQIKTSLDILANSKKYNFDFIFDLLLAFGVPRATVTKLQKGSISRVQNDANAILQKNLIYFRQFPEGSHLEEKARTMQDEQICQKYQPHFVIASDLVSLVAIDNRRSTLSFRTELKNINSTESIKFFYGLTGEEIEALGSSQTEIDYQIAETVNHIYVELEKANFASLQENPDNSSHNLNIFLVRLLFCFFAEDAGIFAPNTFYNSIRKYTKNDGTDLNFFFDNLFKSLQSHKKTGFTEPFKQDSIAPKFNQRARDLILHCAEYDWRSINPGIFGTIFQHTITIGRRDESSMDYTGTTNILKVIEPLFLDNLRQDFDASYNNITKLKNLLNRISQIKIFDPACGSGNFLVISFQKLCDLEDNILKRLGELGDSSCQKVTHLKNFYGIEINDFAHALASLSLIVAFYQSRNFHVESFPDCPSLKLANATRIDWEEVCPQGGEIYILGNPPYKGASRQTPEQKHDFAVFFGGQNYAKNLDYISLWFLKGAKYIENTAAKLAFVATSSIVQGEHAGNLWPLIFSENVEIFAAFLPFQWQNQALNNASVTCVIIALQDKSSSQKYQTKRIYQQAKSQVAHNINAYLIDAEDIIIEARPSPLAHFLPQMTYGNMPLDGNFLKLEETEVAEIIKSSSESEKYIRPLIGARSLVDREKRWCLWIEDRDLHKAQTNKKIAERIEACRNFRETSGIVAKRLAKRSHQFRYRKTAKNNMILLPCTTTINREYLLVGFVDKSFVPDNSVQVIFDADIWVFSLLSSKMHMAWVKMICGRMQNDLRYSATLAYNTFPIPQPDHETLEKMRASANAILQGRESHSDQTLAKLYDPSQMPESLRLAHEKNDKIIDALFQNKTFKNDEERRKCLMKRYISLQNAMKDRETQGYA